MLDPDSRFTLTEALQPPDGFAFDQALAATYSLDLTTLLAVPLHLALFAAKDATNLLQDQIALLEALRRTAARLGIYCQQAQIHPPNVPHVLYGLLESAVVQVRAPGAGVFHPKFWILRFADPVGNGPAWLRVVILSRNLTGDRTWDVAAVVEGEPGVRDLRSNRDLADLVRRLPELGLLPPQKHLRDQADLLADEISRVDWNLPEGFESLRFHVLGLGKKKWMPLNSKRLAVISPFCSETALAALAQTTDEAVALVSRAEDIDNLGSSTQQLFSNLLVLKEAVETENGEDTSASGEENDARLGQGVLLGLHAKAYIAENGWNTHIFLGSANATNSAILVGANVEMMAELVGKRSRVGGVTDLLEEGGFFDVLDPYEPKQQESTDPSIEKAERALEQARGDICRSGLRIACAGNADSWQLSLITERKVSFDGIRSVRTWLVSVREEQAVDACGLSRGTPVVLPACALASVTTFVAFELVAESADLSARFALNLPADGLPADRNAAIIRTIIRNSDGFLRYLMFLLAGSNANLAADQITVGGNRGPFILRNGFPLLEELARTLSRDPSQLLYIKQLVHDLSAAETPERVVPEEFLDLWRVFERAMPEVGN